MWPFKKVLRVQVSDLNGFGTYRKSALSKARLLTEKDFEERRGVIQTKEGPVSFAVGDYLNRGVAGEEWPMKPDKMLSMKEPVSAPDADGWQNWRNINTVRATRVPKRFEVKLSNGDVIAGKAGDFFVDSGSGCWVVDANIFRNSYVQA